ncbi:MAG: hypothetical protein QOG89_1208, partial [Thermomicrobiales bacterium]|nr:hypothetical protein [Thermomicrobiales bacterium]
EAADEEDIRELMDSGLLPVESAADADGDIEFGDEDQVEVDGTGWNATAEGGDDDES